MKLEDLKNNYCLKSAEIIQNLDLTGYTVVNSIDISDKCRFGILNIYVDVVKFITDPEGWLDEFSIIACPLGFKNLIILVSPECPEVYKTVASDIIELIESYLETAKDENNTYLYNSPNLVNRIDDDNTYYKTAINTISGDLYCVNNSAENQIYSLGSITNANISYDRNMDNGVNNISLNLNGDVKY